MSEILTINNNKQNNNQQLYFFDFLVDNYFEIYIPYDYITFTSNDMITFALSKHTITNISVNGMEDYYTYAYRRDFLIYLLYIKKSLDNTNILNWCHTQLSMDRTRVKIIGECYINNLTDADYYDLYYIEDDLF
jgi:hypothetical protein